MTFPGLSRRERQIMDILYQRGKASANEVRDAMPDAPELFGGPRHAARARREGPREAPGRRHEVCLCSPVVAAGKAKRSAVKHVMDTFFQGSAEQIVAALLDVSSTRLDARRVGSYGGDDREAQSRRASKMSHWNEAAWMAFLASLALKSTALLAVAWMAAFAAARRSGGGAPYGLDGGLRGCFGPARIVPRASGARTRPASRWLPDAPSSYFARCASRPATPLATLPAPAAPAPAAFRRKPQRAPRLRISIGRCGSC